MSIEVDDPGDHSCWLPKLGEDARGAFHATLHWRCDECGARWRKRGGTYGWEPLTRSSWRWRRARMKELQAALKQNQP